MQKKFKLHTFGCKTNKYESQLFYDSLKEMNYVQSDDASIHIINSCCVTKKAENEVLLKIKQLLKKDVKIFLTGCASFLFEKLNDKVIVIKDKKKLLSFIEKESQLLTKIKSFDQTRAFIKVQDGCNNFCTYCIIPYVRGRSISRPIDEIEEEISYLVSVGFKEIVLTGINLGDYKYQNYLLYDLLKKISQIKGLHRIRLSSIDPNQIDDRIISLFNLENMCPSLHLSLQSGSDKILKKMNRKYVTKDFFSLISKLEKISNFTFTTDIIVGFPGEDENDFAKTLQIVDRVDFAKVHIFPYSRRTNTVAANFDQVNPKIIVDRKKILFNIANKKSFDVRNKYIHKTLKVLIEGKVKNHYHFGHSENYLLVKIKNEKLKKNQLVNVKIIENCEDCLIGQIDEN